MQRRRKRVWPTRYRADQRGRRDIRLRQGPGVLDRRRGRGVAEESSCVASACNAVATFSRMLLRRTSVASARRSGISPTMTSWMSSVSSSTRPASFSPTVATRCANAWNVLSHGAHGIDAARRRPRLVSSPANVEGRWANLSSRVDEVIRSIWSRSSTTVTDRRLRPRSWTRSSTLPTSAARTPIVEFGCGTGQLSVPLAGNWRGPHVCRVGRPPRGDCRTEALEVRRRTCRVRDVRGLAAADRSLRRSGGRECVPLARP